MSEQRCLFEAEALGAAERAVNLTRATEKAIDDTANALLRGSASGYRDLEKVRELHRLAIVRLEIFVRRLGEGRLTDQRTEAGP